MNKRILPSIVVVLLITNLLGCGLLGKNKSKPETTKSQERTRIKLSVFSDHESNPNSASRASPVYVKFMLLPNTGSFDSAQYEDVFGNDDSELSSMVFEDKIIAPGSNIHIETSGNANFNYLAVAAAFHNIDSSKWKDFIRVDMSESTLQFIVSIEKNAVSIIDIHKP